MNVSLPRELMQFVDECVESGEYKSASAVIRAGLVLLQGAVREQEAGDERDDVRFAEFQIMYLRSVPDIRTEDIDRGIVRRSAGKLAPQKSARPRKHSV